jgi:hypothetical protein
MYGYYILIALLILGLLVDFRAIESYTPWGKVNPKLYRRYVSSPGV